MNKEPNFCENCAMDLVTCDCVVKRPVYVETATDPDCLAPTQGADARPVAIYQINYFGNNGPVWIDCTKEEYADAVSENIKRIVYAPRDAASSSPNLKE